MESLLQCFLTLSGSHSSLGPAQALQNVLCVFFSAQFMKQARFKVETGWSAGRTTFWELKVADAVFCLTVYFFCLALPRDEIKFPCVSGMLQGPLVVFRSSSAIFVSHTRWKKPKPGWTFVLDAHRLVKGRLFLLVFSQAVPWLFVFAFPR